MKPVTWFVSFPTLALAALLASCYTLPTAPARKKVDVTVSASAELHDVIREFVQGSLYTYPQSATRAGMHSYTLPRGDEVDLDRELPNYSSDLVDARIGSLEATLERLEQRVPEAALGPNDLADRRLLVAAIRLELFDWRRLENHRRDPLLHARSLAEALYYPLVTEYAPEEDRLADVLGRLHWVPAYVERAIRMLESSSEPLATAAAEVNRFTIDLVRRDLSARIPEDGELRAAYDGMKKPVLEALEGFQRFLEEDLAGGKRVSWRMGREHYEKRFELASHGAVTPDDLLAAADEVVAGVQRAIYDAALPSYCEANEKDRENCGPTKAEIAAAAKAEEERLRKEEERLRKEEERLRKEEERLRKEEEERKRRADEEAERKKRREEEERRKADEEKIRRKKDIHNPYEDAPKKKKAPSGVTNPYGYYRAPRIDDSAGAKLSGHEGDAAEEAADEDGEPNAAMLERVVSFAFDLLRKPGASPDGAVERLREALSAAADSAADRGFTAAASLDGLSVRLGPPFLAAQSRSLTLVPQPVFQPIQGALLLVAEGDGARLAYSRTFAVAAALGSPGGFEALSRAVEIETETRRALRVLYGDPAWISGWGLYVAAELARAGLADSETGNPRDLLEALAGVILAAVESSVDIRMHTGDLSEADAVSELVNRAGLDRAVARHRVRRIVLAPVEAVAAFRGYQAWIAASAGIDDPPAFYARALGIGPVPVSDLEALLSAADPDAAPDYEGDDADEPGTKNRRRVSVLDTL